MLFLVLDVHEVHSLLPLQTMVCMAMGSNNIWRTNNGNR